MRFTKKYAKIFLHQKIQTTAKAIINTNSPDFQTNIIILEKQPPPQKDLDARAARYNALNRKRYEKKKTKSRYYSDSSNITLTSETTFQFERSRRNAVSNTPIRKKKNNDSSTPKKSVPISLNDTPEGVDNNENKSLTFLNTSNSENSETKQDANKIHDGDNNSDLSVSTFNEKIFKISIETNTDPYISKSKHRRRHHHHKKEGNFHNHSNLNQSHKQKNNDTRDDNNIEEEEEEKENSNMVVDVGANDNIEIRHETEKENDGFILSDKNITEKDKNENLRSSPEFKSSDECDLEDINNNISVTNQNDHIHNNSETQKNGIQNEAKEGIGNHEIIESASRNDESNDDIINIKNDPTKSHVKRDIIEIEEEEEENDSDVNLKSPKSQKSPPSAKSANSASIKNGHITSEVISNEDDEFASECIVQFEVKGSDASVSVREEDEDEEAGMKSAKSDTAGREEAGSDAAGGLSRLHVQCLSASSSSTSILLSPTSVPTSGAQVRAGGRQGKDASRAIQAAGDAKSEPGSSESENHAGSSDEGRNEEKFTPSSSSGTHGKVSLNKESAETKDDETLSCKESENKSSKEDENKSNKESENKSNKEDENEFNKEDENEFNKEDENEFNKEDENEFNKEDENKFNKESENKSSKEDENKSNKESENKSNKESENKSNKESENKSNKESENKSSKEDENKSNKESENKSNKESENKSNKEDENEFNKEDENEFNKEDENEFNKEDENEFNKEDENKFNKESENKSSKESENKSNKESENKSNKESENKSNKESENKSNKESENKSSKEDENKSNKESENKSNKESENKSNKEDENEFNKEDENEFNKESENKSNKESENKSNKESENKSNKESENKSNKEDENEFNKEDENEFNKEDENEFNKEDENESSKESGIESSKEGSSVKCEAVRHSPEGGRSHVPAKRDVSNQTSIVSSGLLEEDSTSKFSVDCYASDERKSQTERTSASSVEGHPAAGAQHSHLTRVISMVPVDERDVLPLDDDLVQPSASPASLFGSPRRAPSLTLHSKVDFSFPPASAICDEADIETNTRRETDTSQCGSFSSARVVIDVKRKKITAKNRHKHHSNRHDKHHHRDEVSDATTSDVIHFTSPKLNARSPGSLIQPLDQVVNSFLNAPVMNENISDLKPNGSPSQYYAQPSAGPPENGFRSPFVAMSGLAQMSPLNESLAYTSRARAAQRTRHSAQQAAPQTTRAQKGFGSPGFFVPQRTPQTLQAITRKSQQQHRLRTGDKTPVRAAPDPPGAARQPANAKKDFITPKHPDDICLTDSYCSSSQVQRPKVVVSATPAQQARSDASQLRRSQPSSVPRSLVRYL